MRILRLGWTGYNKVTDNKCVSMKIWLGGALASWLLKSCFLPMAKAIGDGCVFAIAGTHILLQQVTSKVDMLQIVVV